MSTIKEALRELLALKYTSWYRWHPQLALRYLPVVETIKDEGKRLKDKGKQKLTILEIGSGGLGVAPYLRMPVTGVDVAFDPPIHPLLTPVVGDATNLKFKNNSFDIIVSMDMLEHLPKEKRGQAIGEMMRIAKKAVVIGVPCGTRSLAHDKNIQSSYKKRFGREFPFAKEHIQFGLPEESDIVHMVEASAKALRKEIEMEIKGNLNLRLREFLMWGWIRDNIFVNMLFRKVFLLLIPLFRAIDRPPYYRKIFFVRIKESQ